MLFNAAGQPTNVTHYESYGGVRACYGVDSTKGFKSEQYDESGLISLRARYYDPKLGMFIKVDPVMGLVGTVATHWNPYIYAYANLLNLTDPIGEFIALLIVALRNAKKSRRF